MTPYSEIVQSLYAERAAHVEVTLVDVRGGAPADVGARALVGKTGLIWGTVGGGKVEAKAITYARDLIQNRANSGGELVVWNLQKDVGMTCGGEVKLFFRGVFTDDWHIAVFGAGHVAQALVPVLLTLDCVVTCVDPRSEWLDRMAPHPRLRKVSSETPEAVVDSLPSDTYFVVMTQGHATDVPVLRAVLGGRQAPFLGVIGSHAKRLVLQRDLRQQGLGEDLLDGFHCPIGLAVGNNAPAEIAISVAAHLLKARDQKRNLARPAPIEAPAQNRPDALL